MFTVLFFQKNFCLKKNTKNLITDEFLGKVFSSLFSLMSFEFCAPSGNAPSPVTLPTQILFGILGPLLLGNSLGLIIKVYKILSQELSRLILITLRNKWQAISLPSFHK